MKKEEKTFAENVLQHLFLGAQVDGIQFGMSPSTIKIIFVNYEVNSLVSDEFDFGGQSFLNIESKWNLFERTPESYPLNENDIKEYSEEVEYESIFKIRRQKVVHIELGEQVPHLLITLQNGYTIFVNGFHDNYECWQAGVPYEDDTWLVVAVPGTEIAVWAPHDFKEE
ncbi:MAG: hypothetical protein ACQEUT_11760 [Bacillota bacterium]